MPRIRAFSRVPYQPARASGRILVSLYALLVVRLRFRMDTLSPQSGFGFSSFPADALNPPYRGAGVTTVASCGHLSQKVLGTEIGFLTYGPCFTWTNKTGGCVHAPSALQLQCETKIYPPNHVPGYRGKTSMIARISSNTRPAVYHIL
ncbi:hypothetical protein EDD15DRAFT_1451866 [Pisolithus albus]|nr:hypothetical protein EDD15DRAFT_1451866 [Pisolithus albus]